MPVITQGDVINAYIQYTGRPPTQAEIDQHTGQTVPNIAEAARRFFLGDQPAGGGEEGGFEFEMPDFGALGQMSEVETKYFNLLNQQIQQQIDIQNRENQRVEARRKALDAQIRGEYGIGLDQFEGEEAFRAAKTSRAQGERLDKALAGNLPVDPALERQIGEDERTVRAKLAEQVGPGYETSTPGIQSLADFRQRAEELRSAARHDEIAAGIAPSAASAQFGLSMIGNPTLPDTTSIAQGLQAGIGSRQASIQAVQGRANAILAAQEMAQRERLAQLQADLERQRINAALASTYGGGGAVYRPTGRGAGQATGAVTGTALTYFGSDPFRN
jgi:hypothetical protein